MCYQCLVLVLSSSAEDLLTWLIINNWKSFLRNIWKLVIEWRMSHFTLRRSAFTNIQATLANWQGIAAQSTDVLVHWNYNRGVIHLSFNGGSENHEEDDQEGTNLLVKCNHDGFHHYIDDAGMFISLKDWHIFYDNICNKLHNCIIINIQQLSPWLWIWMSWSTTWITSWISLMPAGQRGMMETQMFQWESVGNNNCNNRLYSTKNNI